MHTHYETLDVPPDATEADIKAAYRRSAMRWHPDRNPDDLRNAERKFKELGAAYAVLSDVKKRRVYDNDLEQVARGGTASEHHENFDAEDAAAIFLRAMVEMCVSMATAGHNRDVLFGALLSQGCPETIAKRIADDTMRALKKAKADEARRLKEAAQLKKVQEVLARKQAAEENRKHENAQQYEVATNIKSSNTLTWVLGFVVAVLLIVVFNGGVKQSETQVRSIAPLPSRAKEVQSIENSNYRSREQVKIFKLAVAARNANIRKGPSAKSGIVGIAGRGAALNELDRENGFVKIELEDGRQGWISDQILIERSNAAKLSETTAIQYAVTASRKAAVDDYLRAVAQRDFTERVRSTFTAAANDPTRLNSDIQDIVLSLQLPTTFGADADARRWWLLEAKWLSDNGTDPSEELAAALAAAQADPADVDALMAVGMASIKAEAWDTIFNRLGYTLPLLAPSSTNTWIIVAAWAAQRGEEKLAASSLALAMLKSKNPEVTRTYIKKVALKASNPLVASAFRLESPTSDAAQLGAAPTHPGPSSPATGASLSKNISLDLNCPGMNRYAPNYEQRMTALVAAAGGLEALTRYTPAQVDLVDAVCRNDRNIAIGMARANLVDARFAEKVRQILAPNMPSLLNASGRVL